jgi:hypothetical protein
MRRSVPINLAACRTPSWVMVRLPRVRLCSSDAENRNGSCKTKAILPRRSASDIR